MSIPSRDHRRNLLSPDCGNCFALCCVALSFTRSADFALDKPAGDPCINLQADFTCGIHDRLRSSGFKGCTSFDCFGAGQKVAQTTFEGVSWVERPESRAQMFAVFPVMRELHELLWYLSEALELEAQNGATERIAEAFESISGLIEQSPDQLTDLKIDSHRELVSELLAEVSQYVRSTVPESSQKLRPIPGFGPRADLIARDLSHSDLRGADLRSACMIGANLGGSDLTSADLIGADLRDARLDGADLSHSLFLTQQQVSSAQGDRRTKLPQGIVRPDHWA